MQFIYERKPSTKQIVLDWTKAGKPSAFSVGVGETFAEFERFGANWDDSGNGCRGVNRAAVVKLLMESK